MKVAAGADPNAIFPGQTSFDYWTRLVPGRLRYVVLCNFDEFHVYDFETQMDSPVGIAKLDRLAERYVPFGLLLRAGRHPSGSLVKGLASEGRANDRHRSLLVAVGHLLD